MNGFLEPPALRAPFVDVTTEGASVSISDNAAAFQRAMDKAYLKGWSLFIPPGIWRTRAGIVHRPGVRAFGAGKTRTTVRNEATVAGMPTAVAWHFGTYGPAVSSSATKHEPGYLVEDAPAGSRSLTLSTSAESAAFSAGDLISFEGGGDRGSLGPNVPNGVARISGVVSGVLYLDVPLAVDLLADSAAPTVRRLNTGAVPSLAAAVGDTEGATLLTDAHLSGLTVESTVTGYPPVNLSCFDCTIKDVKTLGWTSLSGNPVARSAFLQISGFFTNGAIEFAYLSHDSRVDDSVFVRQGTDTSPSSSVGIWVNSTEGARSIHFSGTSIIEATTQTFTSPHPTVELGDGCTWRDGSVHSDRSGAGGGMWAYGDGALIDGVLVTKSTGDGVQLGGPGSELRNSRVLGTPSGARAVLAAPSAAGAIIRDNDLGLAGSRGVMDAVYDLGSDTRCSGNLTYYSASKTPVRVTFPSSTSGVQAEYDLAAISWTPGEIEGAMGFTFRLTGSASGPGAKTVRLRIDTVSVAALTIPTGVTHWAMEGCLYVAQGPDQWSYQLSTVLGGIAGGLTGRVTRNYPASSKVSVTAQTGDADDVFTVDIRRLEFDSSMSFRA